MFFLLLSVCIAKCPYVPVDADLMQVVPGGGLGASTWEALG